MFHTFIRSNFAQALQLARGDLRDPARPIDDERMIDAVRDPNRQDRVVLVLRWLAKYKLLRLRGPDVKENVAQAALACLDGLPRTFHGHSIIEYALQLERACAVRLPRKKNGEERSEPSLASKLLWCKYPTLVPIYDSHAVRAILVLSKLMEVPRPVVGDSEYARFVDAWNAIYDQVETLITQANDGRYPHKVRLFDKLLWILGEREYGSRNLRLPVAAE